MKSQAAQPSDDELDRLFRQLAQGGPEAEAAVTTLYRHYRGPVLGHLHRGGLDQQAAEDVLHTVFIKLAQSSRQWRGDGSANAWFWAIVRNAKIDHFRASKGEVLLDDDGWASLAGKVPVLDDEPGASASLQTCVGQALQRFAKAHPERADAIRLLHQEDWSIAEVAQYLGRTDGATRQFLSQCRKVFKTFVEPCLAWLRP